MVISQMVYKGTFGKFAEQGFTAREEGDHILIIEHDGEEVARFNAVTAGIEEIRTACQQHLLMKHGV